MTTSSREVTSKAEEYLEVLKKMVLDYPKDTVEKVNQNITNDREFYSKSENIKRRMQMNWLFITLLLVQW